ncbi:MAG: penicillin acylase family protein [Pseudomonadota bacterium]
MAVLFKWTLRVFLAIATLTLGAVFIVYYLGSRSLPDYSASYQDANVTAPLEIVRSNANLPHIFGETDEDVFFGLGFAHAQDRLWQMTLFRRTVQGKLSELFGARTVEIDELLRRLDLYNIAARSVPAQGPEAQAALQAYANGVNAWLKIINEDALGRGAPEFFLFEPAIAPWQPADSLAILKLLSLQVSSHLQHEVLRARLSFLLEPERVEDLLPDTPGRGIAGLDYAGLLPDADFPKIAGLNRPAKDPLSPVSEMELAGASNAFAASPRRSAAGGTLLANDPHLGLTAPGPFYLARLELESGGVIGGTVPGLPLVVSGRSEVTGWGLTTAVADDQDLYIEQLHPSDPNRYLTPEGFKPFRTAQSIIRVKDSPPVTINLQWTENGPVLPGHIFDLATITPAGHVMSLAWTTLAESDPSFDGSLDVMKAKSLEDIRNAPARHIAPIQNLTFADQTGVALKTTGALPRRDRDHQSQGRIPVPGWLPQNRWQGVLPYASNPEVMRPDGGIVGNTNNKVIDRPFPNHVSHFYTDTQRVQRWRRLMLNRQVHTRDSFIEAQLDTVSFTARALLPLIASDLWFTGTPAAEGTPERQRQKALELMAAWNGEMSEHLPEPLIYAKWLRVLQKRLILDDLGPVQEELTHVQPLFIERVFRDRNGASAWCDIEQSAAVENCSDLARLALDEALILLSEQYGPNIESWRWGDAHEATHDHPVLGSIPILSWFVNIRQSTSGGDNTLMRGRTKGSGENPFLNVHAAAYRGVYDFADPDSSVFVISTGQSGHPLSRHYDDLGALWRRGEYLPMSLDPDLARAGAVGVTTLRPASTGAPSP